MPSHATRQAIARWRANVNYRTDAIDSSYTTGGTLLSAAAGSSDASISIIAHSRVYAAETGFGTVSLSSGTLTGRTFGTTHYVFYDDPTLASTAPTYQSSTDARIAQANYAQGRHPLGEVIMPSSAGAPATSGGGALPPSGGSGGNPIP